MAGQEMRVFWAAMLLFLGTVPQARTAEPSPVCPDKLSATYTLLSHSAGWEAMRSEIFGTPPEPFQGKITINVSLAAVRFYLGQPGGAPAITVTRTIKPPLPPEEEYKRPNLPFEEIWDLSDARFRDRPIWLGCGYSGVDTELNRPLPPDIRECRVRYWAERSVTGMECR